MFNKHTIKIAKKIEKLGGRLFLVGGAVRDIILKRPVHDFDFVVTGLNKDTFEVNFGFPKMTGKQFPVFRLMMGDSECEVALARKEQKIAEGHNGFVMSFDASITIKEDLFRRDVTANAIALDVLTNKIVDPFNGLKDIKNHTLSAVSTHFCEDPLRVLRVARQCATFNFHTDEKTISLMKSCKEELTTVPHERIFGELEKALTATKPSTFFNVLKDCEALEIVFPELFNLTDEDFLQSMEIADKVAKKTDDTLTRFCAVFHKVNADIIHDWTDGRFPAKFKKVSFMVNENITNVNGNENILDLLTSVRRNLKTFRIVAETANNTSFEFLSNPFVDKVFAKIVIPENLNSSKDGEKIAQFIRKVRLERINENQKI